MHLPRCSARYVIVGGCRQQRVRWVVYDVNQVMRTMQVAKPSAKGVTKVNFALGIWKHLCAGNAQRDSNKMRSVPRRAFLGK